MNSLRIARTVRFLPTASRLSLRSRGYADAVSDKIQLTLALPHQVPMSPHCRPHTAAFLPTLSADSFINLQSIFKSTDVYATITLY